MLDDKFNPKIAQNFKQQRLKFKVHTRYKPKTGPDSFHDGMEIQKELAKAEKRGRLCKRSLKGVCRPRILFLVGYKGVHGKISL